MLSDDDLPKTMTLAVNNVMVVDIVDVNRATFKIGVRLAAAMQPTSRVTRARRAGL